MSRSKKLRIGIHLSVSTIFFLFSVWGCAHQHFERPDPFFNQWRIKAEKVKGYSPSSKRRTLNLSSSVGKKTGKSFESEKKTPLPDKKITMRIHQTDVATLLRALARSVDQNIIISENVKGQISINVSQTPWDQVFLGILKTHSLSYSFDKSILRVLTIEDKKKQISQMEADSKIKAKLKDLELTDPLITQIIEVEYSNAAKLKGNLERFLTQRAEGRSIGSILVDDHTNAIIVQALRSDLAQIIPLIEALDRPTPQILIVANIVETTKDVARNLGVQWGGLAQSGDTYFYPGKYSKGVMGNPIDQSINPTSDFASNFPGISEEGIGFSAGIAAERLGRNILAMQLSTLQKEGKLNILSSPSITTLDNQSATIESGDEVPFQTVENGEVNIDYKKAVLRLKVTPHVIEGETLKLGIETSKDEIDFSRTVSGNPTIVTKKAETNVVLFDGQTTVIGGLNKETGSRSDSGIPGLMNIPILGWLFRSKEKSNKMEEVLIFITPHILKERSVAMKLSGPSKETGSP